MFFGDVLVMNGKCRINFYKLKYTLKKDVYL